jgi:hypothetical protein
METVMSAPVRAPSHVWFGRTLSAFVVLVLVADGGVDVLKPALVAPQMAETGFPGFLAGPLGWIILITALLYAFPQTTFLGAIFVTGFIGGAIATHFRLGEFGSPPQIISTLIAIAAWGGLYLRDARLRALLPWTRPQ